MIKKLSIVLITLTFCLLAFAQNAFPDTPDTKVFDFLKQTQLTDADSYQSYSPNTTLNRASLIKMVMLATSFTETDADTCIQDKLSRKWQFVYFKDVKVTDWLAPYVCIGVENNLLLKSGKFLKPSKAVTFLEAAQVLFYALNKNGLFLNIDPNSHPKVLFAEMQKLGLPVNSSDTHKKISRGDFAKMLFDLSGLLLSQTTENQSEIVPSTAENSEPKRILKPITITKTSGSGATGGFYGSGGGGGGGAGGGSAPQPPPAPPQPVGCYAKVQPVTGPANQARLWPISGALIPDQMSSAFGPRLQASAGSVYDFHRGVDIPTPVGTPIKVVADGVVNTVYLESDPQNPYPGGGTVIGVKHEDSGVYYSLYMHLSSVIAQKGQAVKKGDVIGLSGNSGTTTFDHLHFEIRENDINSASEPHRNSFSYLPYNNTANHTAEILEAGKINAKNPVVTVRVKSPRNELDINKIKVTIYRRSDCLILSAKETDFNKRINSGTDSPTSNGVTLNPAGFNKDSSEYSLDITFSGLAGADDTLLAVAEVSDVTGNTIYTEANIAKPVSLLKMPDENTRAMWVWGYWEQLKNNPANTTAFINFLKAPHGNTAYAINRIFLSRDGALDFSKPSDVTSMQSFLQTANSNSIVTEALFSDYGWAYTAQKHIPIGLCQNVIDFNKSTPATEDDFAGIHFDIEPHTLPEWRQNFAGGTDEYNNELEANLLDIMMQCRQKITASGLPLTLTLDVPANWHISGTDIWPYLTATNSPVDYITVMNYFDSPERFINGWGTKGGVKNILQTGGSIPLVFGAEVSDVTGIDNETVSFFEEGYLEMENAFNLAKSQYSANPLFSGITVHHYNSYKIAPAQPKYPIHKNITSTYFYIGEPADASNGFIANDDSAWDEMWKEHYGGVDDPVNRNGNYPAGFTPLENPWYIALPYSDFDTVGRKTNSSSVYWANEKTYAPNESMIKNRWVKIIKNSDVIYAQWEDAGPFNSDDMNYVFGSSAPLNTVNQNAGIDVSPAIKHYLGLSDIDTLTWNFVDASKVPDGPWKQIVTTSGTYWTSPPPPPPPPASGCSGNQTTFITDKTIRQEPVISKPVAGAPFRDQVFGSCITRVTDVSTDLISPDTSLGFKNEYSRVNSWNSDQSKILIRSLGANWYVYSAQTLKPIKMLSVGGSIDPRWDATNPDILYFIDGTTINTYNVSTDSITVLRDFAGDFPGQTVSAVWTRYEGSPTSDSRYWGLMAEDQNWNTFAFLIYDAQQNVITTQRTLPQPYDIDNVSISPLGNYFTAFYDICPAGTLGTDQSPCGLMVYDNNLQNGRGLLRAIGHSDFAIDVNGREVFVYQDVSTDNISVLDLGTGAITDLFPIDFSHSALGIHISGQNFNKPGWALISMYNGSYPTNMTWMDNQVFAVELSSGNVFRIAHHHSLYNENMPQDYWAEPQASVNRDFTKILFTSNWGQSGTENTDAYLVSIPDTCWISNSCTASLDLTKYPNYNGSDPFHKIRKYLVFYGTVDNTMADKIIADGYGMVIVHPMWGSAAGNNLTADEIARLKAGGVKVIGYISFGEDDYATGTVVESYHIDKNNDGLPDKNPNWPSYYVNGNADWQALINTKLQQMSALGYDGVFMDTLDTVNKWDGFPEFQANYLQMVKGAKANFPGMHFISNNGFDLFLDYPYAQSIAPDVSAAMIESFDPLQSGDITAINGLNAIRLSSANSFFHVIGLQYALTTDPDYARYLQAFLDYDMLGYISSSRGLDVYPTN